MVEGEGGRLGPDLTAVGTARTVEALIESVRSPSKRLAWGLSESTKEFAEEYQTVTVVTQDGHEIKGVTLNEDQFSLQMMDKTEQIHLLEKNKLRSIRKSRESMMPPYDTAALSDQDLNDIVSYLLSVGTK
jgi:putative heme-binding domain-containing protein